MGAHDVYPGPSKSGRTVLALARREKQKEGTGRKEKHSRGANKHASPKQHQRHYTEKRLQQFCCRLCGLSNIVYRHDVIVNLSRGLILLSLSLSIFSFLHLLFDFITKHHTNRNDSTTSTSMRSLFPTIDDTLLVSVGDDSTWTEMWKEQKTKYLRGSRKVQLRTKWAKTTKNGNDFIVHLENIPPQPQSRRKE